MDKRLAKVAVGQKRSPGFCESTSVDGTGSSQSSLLAGPAPPAVSAPAPPAVEPPTKKARMSEEQRLDTMARAVETLIGCIDDDPCREGLRKTPMRYAKALLSLTEGYRQSPTEVLGDAEFDENHSEMVLVRNIDVFSLCEHHLLPFHGQCHVAYIPDGSVVGLSKIARIVDLYSRRFQVQERLTTQIADAVSIATRAKGVMVHITCSHMCMVMRGVRKVGTETTTSAARGCYADDPDLRREFIAVVCAESRR